MVKRASVVSPTGSGSRMNAVKNGYYVKQLLPWEDAQQMEAQRQQLHVQWSSADDPTSQELVDQLHSVQVRIRRLERLEDEYVTTRLYGQAARLEFCKEAGIDPSRAHELPDWFFDESEPPRQEARRLLEVYEELVRMEFYDTALSPRVRRSKYPKAMAEMLRTPGEVRINLERRIQREGLAGGDVGSPGLFLRCFEQEYVFELFWAKNPKRCEGLVRGLRASIALNAQSQESWGRLLTALFKQQHGLLSALGALRQQHL